MTETLTNSLAPNRVLQMDSDGASHIGPGPGQVMVTSGHACIIVETNGEAQLSSHLQLHDRDTFSTTRGGVITEEQPSVIVEDTTWAATLIKESIETNPKITAEASAVMEELLSGRLLERELTPTGLREVAQRLIKSIVQATADPKENLAN